MTATRESDQGNRRIFDLLAGACGLLYVAVVVYALANWYGVPSSFWSHIGRGAAISLLLILFLTGVATSIGEYRAGRISVALNWTILGIETTLFVGLMFAALELRSIQADIQHYVLPRELTDQQIKSIHDYLVAHPQPNDAALTIMFAYQDSEASHSADQFFQAIRGTGSDVVEGRGWTVQMQGLTDTAMIAKGIYEGVQLQQRWPCTLNNGNVKSAALLQEALEKAHLQFGGGGSCENSRTDNAVWLVVSHRPRTYQPPMKMQMVPADQ